MPFALPSGTVAAAPRATKTGVASPRSATGTETSRPTIWPRADPGWFRVRRGGVVWALREAGHSVAPADLVLTSDVPVGAGLSSSAALECAVLTALVDLGGLDVPRLERARLAQRAENGFVGAPTGLMDQAASTLSTAGHALFCDCRSHADEPVALDLPAAGLELLVLDTRTPTPCRQ